MNNFLLLILFVVLNSLNAQDFYAEINSSPSSILCSDQLTVNGNYDGDDSYVKRWIVKDFSFEGEVIDSLELEHGYHRTTSGLDDRFYIVYEVERKSDGEITRDSVEIEVVFDNNEAIHLTLSYGSSIQWGDFLDFSNISHIALEWFPYESICECYYSSDYFDFDSFGVGEHAFEIVRQCSTDSLYITVLDSATTSCSENMMIFESTPAFRNGFEDTRTIRFMNGGNQIMYDVEGYILIDEYLNFVSATSEIGYVAEEGTDSIVFSIDSLHPSESMVIRINSAVPADETQMGREITFKSEVWNSCLRDEGNSVTKTIVREIRAPYDPNHKEALIGDGGMSPDTEELTYLIEFQNLGNDTAFKVIVEDTINPNYFDIQGIEMLTSSDPYEMTIDSALNLVRWTFNDIHLVDSATNEPESHGNFSFKIPLKSDFGLDDVAENTAYIYFDFNSAIVTNTAFNYFENSTGIEEFNKNISLDVSQKYEKLFVSINSEVSNQQDFLIVDLEGRMVYSTSINLQKGLSNLTIPIGNLTSGIYVIQMGSKAVKFPVLK